MSNVQSILARIKDDHIFTRGSYTIKVTEAHTPKGKPNALGALVEVVEDVRGLVFRDWCNVSNPPIHYPTPDGNVEGPDGVMYGNDPLVALEKIIFNTVESLLK